MVRVKRLVLDVLKPHIPNGLIFSKAIAEQGEDWHVLYSVEEIDEKTESITVVIEGDDVQFERISRAIEEIGGSVHSIDEVEVSNETNRQ